MRKIFLSLSLVSIGLSGFMGIAYANAQNSPFAPLDAVVQEGLELPKLPRPDLYTTNQMKQTTSNPVQEPTSMPAAKNQTVPQKTRNEKQPQTKKQVPTAQPNYGISGLPAEQTETDSPDQGFKLHF